MDFYAPDILTHGVQNGAVGGVSQIVRAGEGFVAAGDLETKVGFLEGHVGIQTQGAAESVKPGAEVRGGGGNADGDTIHDMNSPCGNAE